MRSLPTRHFAIVVVLVAVASTAACGGGGTDTMPLDSWRAQADGICVVARQQADAAQPVTGAGNPAVPVRARAQLVQTEADQIAELDEPDQQAETSRELVDAMQRQSEALDELADALLADPTATSGVVGAAVTVETDKVTEAATALDLASCTTHATTTTDTEGDGGQVAPEDEGFGTGIETEDG